MRALLLVAVTLVLVGCAGEPATSAMPSPTARSGPSAAPTVAVLSPSPVRATDPVAGEAFCELVDALREDMRSMEVADVLAGGSDRFTAYVGQVKSRLLEIRVAAPDLEASIVDLRATWDGVRAAVEASSPVPSGELPDKTVLDAFDAVVAAWLPLSRRLLERCPPRG